MEKPEAKQMFDLLSSIFKWHPEQRATLTDMLNDEWFGERGRNRAVPPGPKAPRQRSPKGQEGEA